MSPSPAEVGRIRFVKTRSPTWTAGSMLPLRTMSGRYPATSATGSVARTETARTTAAVAARLTTRLVRGWARAPSRCARPVATSASSGEALGVARLPGERLRRALALGSALVLDRDLEPVRVGLVRRPRPRRARGRIDEGRGVVVGVALVRAVEDDAGAGADVVGGVGAEVAAGREVRGADRPASHRQVEVLVEPGAGGCPVQAHSGRKRARVGDDDALRRRVARLETGEREHGAAGVVVAD